VRVTCVAVRCTPDEKDKREEKKKSIQQAPDRNSREGLCVCMGGRGEKKPDAFFRSSSLQAFIEILCCARVCELFLKIGFRHAATIVRKDLAFACLPILP